MAPGGVRNSIYWAFHPPLTPRARSATHQLHQLILLPRWLDPSNATSPPNRARLQLGHWAPIGISTAAGRLPRPPPLFSGPQPSTRPQLRSRAGPCILQESPVAPSRLPSRRFGSRPHARPRLRLRAQASGHQSLLLADSGTLRGRRGGPLMLDPFRRLRPTAWTPIGPEKARFRTLTRRPLRSEKFRRAPSPGPWPRPLVSN
ncbi:hypothetical protein NDU88_004939 [Pleurodeles waltl]|uniref:Uncharacterized protein n=1 Tax=Pleurodeles waltl TaxID=8319 RepID=A0AAV7QJB6_PLEWA|nr:hypothetical protein NDU88_004939 [Pleurodeles waltl]